MTILSLHEALQSRFTEGVVSLEEAHGELTLTLDPAQLTSVMQALRYEPVFTFEQMMDVCVVDYLDYGKSEWETTQSTRLGFSRAVCPIEDDDLAKMPKRFAVVYHLLSLTHNQRLRVKVFVDEETLTVDSVLPLWESANWFEREAYDLFGIRFKGHPDLRRILTDYGFVGHPFRKDFPVSGYVEVRYDAAQEKVIYEPVSIPPRTLVPKVIRDDNRYAGKKETSS